MSETVEEQAYTPTTWVDGATPVNAANLNKLEAAAQLTDAIAAGGRLGPQAAPTTDWDLATASGWYYSAPGAGTHAPDAVALWVGEVQAYGSGISLRVTQRVWNAGAAGGATMPPTWERSFNGSIWSAWTLAGAGGGADLSYDGDWAAGTYQDGDVVVKDGIAYLCVGGPTTVAPDPAPWGAAAISKPSYGTTLPASPVDGQEHILVDSLTNPSYQWRFRYNAGSASAYKWEFVGGDGMAAEIAANENVTTTGYGDPATPGPQLTVPLAGDYLLSYGATLTTNPTSLALVVAAPSIGGAAPSTSDNVILQTPSAGAMGASVSRQTRKTIAVAGSVVKLQYSTSTGTAQAGRRTLAIRPVRVG